MNKKEALELILIKRTYKDCRISLDKLLSVISKDSYSLKELGYSSAGGVSGFTKRNFPNKPRTNIKLCTYLLMLEGLSHCSKCKNVYEVACFSKNKSNIRGLNGWCKACQGIHQHENLGVWRHYRSIRRARELQAIPKWETLEEVRLFYTNSPDGYHVDHIIPLKNDLVCGLHTLDNLQYLTKEENLKKSNGFVV